MSNQSIGAVIFAKDISRVAQFYEAILCMTVIHAERDRIMVLEATGCQLVIHAIPQDIAASIEITTPPERRTEMPVKLFFGVPSIAEARAMAKTLGGAIMPIEREWESRHFRACDGYDPEGNVIQVRETIANH
jgi:predicted enzyme related to lactoylglutathione lyase